MPDLRGCWSCGAHGPCLPVCYCAKCRDPHTYNAWKYDNPEEYEAWLARQRLGPDEKCDCPSCLDW